MHKRMRAFYIAPVKISRDYHFLLHIGPMNSLPNDPYDIYVAVSPWLPDDLADLVAGYFELNWIPFPQAQRHADVIYEFSVNLVYNQHFMEVRSASPSQTQKSTASRAEHMISIPGWAYPRLFLLFQTMHLLRRNEVYIMPPQHTY